MNELREMFKINPIFKETKRIEEQMDKCDDLIEITELMDRLDAIKDYSVALIKRVKDSDEEAFDELMDTKDMRNFLYYYAYHINKYHKFCYDENVVVSEIRYQIFYHIKTRYKIYDQYNEISLLIVSMRKWIRGAVSKSLKNAFFPKQDASINFKNVEEDTDDFSVLVVNELIEKCLDDEEKEIFNLRFYDRFGLVDIGKRLGISKATVGRRYQRALEKIKDELERSV